MSDVEKPRTTGIRIPMDQAAKPKKNNKGWHRSKDAHDTSAQMEKREWK